MMANSLDFLFESHSPDLEERKRAIQEGQWVKTKMAQQKPAFSS